MRKTNEKPAAAVGAGGGRVRAVERVSRLPLQIILWLGRYGKYPDHLTRSEAAMWFVAEDARRRGDLVALWRLRKTMLLSQAERYVGVQP